MGDQVVVEKKNIFATKTFWLNAIGIAGMAFSAGGFIPISPTAAGYVLAGLNIANRFLTQGPATLMPQGDNK